MTRLRLDGAKVVRSAMLLMALVSGAQTSVAWAWNEGNQGPQGSWGGSSFQPDDGARQAWGGGDYGYQQAPQAEPRRADNPWAVGPPSYGTQGGAPTPRPWSDVPNQDQERAARRRESRRVPAPAPLPQYNQQGFPGSGYDGRDPYGAGYYGGYPGYRGYAQPYPGGYPGWGYADPYYGDGPWGGGAPWGGGWPFGGSGWGSPLGGMPFFGPW